MSHQDITQQTFPVFCYEVTIYGWPIRDNVVVHQCHMLSSDKDGAELAYHVTELVSTHALFPWQLRNKTKAQ